MLVKGGVSANAEVLFGDERDGRGELAVEAMELAEGRAPFLVNFYGTLIRFLGQNVKFFGKVFDKMSKEKINGFYAELFQQIINEYKDRIKEEFVFLKLDEAEANAETISFTKTSQIHSEIFNIVILSALETCQEIVIFQKEYNEESQGK